MHELQIELGCVYGLVFLKNVYVIIKNRLNEDDDHYDIKKSKCNSNKLLRSLVD